MTHGRDILAAKVSRETLDRLDAYSARLIHWNRKLNLVSRTTLDDLWTRHILDSAQFAWLAGSGFRSWVDVGSGAGLPGFIVAICLAETNPSAHVTLIEKDERKAAFLFEVSRRCMVPVTIECLRIERGEGLGDRRFDVVSARAVAHLGDLLDLTAPLLAPGGVCLFAKGRSAAREIEEANRHWRMDLLSEPSLTEAGSVILSVRNPRRDRNE